MDIVKNSGYVVGAAALGQFMDMSLGTPIGNAFASQNKTQLIASIAVMCAADALLVSTFFNYMSPQSAFLSTQFVLIPQTTFLSTVATYITDGMGSTALNSNEIR